MAAREELDNLTFVVNCNLQRLDGPVRGNGKIIQELEAFFRGAGWNVIKVIWGRRVGPAARRRHRRRAGQPDERHAGRRLPDLQGRVRGVRPRALLRPRPAHRRHGRSTCPTTQIWGLKRGGHDYRKLYAAYRAATEHTGQPTVILAKTIKGWTLGSHFEGRNATHQMKKLTLDDLKGFRDRLYLDIPDSALDETLPPYYRPPDDSPELEYLHERRRALGGYLPARTVPQHAARPARRPRRTRSPAAAPAGSRSPPRWRSSGCSRT